MRTAHGELLESVSVVQDNDYRQPMMDKHHIQGEGGREEWEGGEGGGSGSRVGGGITSSVPTLTCPVSLL